MSTATIVIILFPLAFAAYLVMYDAVSGKMSDKKDKTIRK